MTVLGVLSILDPVDLWSWPYYFISIWNLSLRKHLTVMLFYVISLWWDDAVSHETYEIVGIKQAQLIKLIDI